MWPENIFGKVQKDDNRLQDVAKPSAPERDELKSFISFLHVVLVKILRDKEKSVRVIVPRGKGTNLMITVQEVPHGMKPADDFFVMDYSHVEKAVKSETFNTQQLDFEAIENG